MSNTLNDCIFSQSIRRTSIREKAQISRREAREEARMRQETEERTKLLDVCYMVHFSCLINFMNMVIFILSFASNFFSKAHGIIKTLFNL